MLATLYVSDRDLKIFYLAGLTRLIVVFINEVVKQGIIPRKLFAGQDHDGEYFTRLRKYCGGLMPNLRKKRNFNQKNTIDVLLKTTEADWYKFFDKLGLLISEYSQSTHSSNKNNRIIFFKFLKKVFSTDSFQNLIDTEKKILFSLATDEITKHGYVLTNIEDLEMLYDRFNVFLRVKHKNEAPHVLNLISMYADQIVNSNIVLDKAIDHLDWNFTNLFWVLNVNFFNYVEKDISYLNFRKYFDSLQKMNNEIRRWDPDSIFSFRTVLGTYRTVRTNLQGNSEIRNFLDQITKDTISNIVKLTENSCFSLTINQIKECAYIEYVKDLVDSEKNLFTNLYKTVDKQQVFPDEYTYQSGPFKVIVSFQQLTEDEKNIIREAIIETYTRVDKLKFDLQLNFKEPIEDQIFRLYIFKNNDEYVKYGPLWGVNTAGGGYAHVRAPSENDRPLIDYRPLSNSEQWYETFIYQQISDTRNRLSKEGGNFRNLGHEIQHTLFYALLGQQGLHCLPSWIIEGSANALGNENCFKEEADYIKNSKNELPSLERIINMSYASGGDLYYFGSALFRFIRDKHINLLEQIIIKAQNRESINEINSFIKTKFAPYEKDFKEWLDKKIEACSVVDANQHSKEISDKDSQSLYKKDLENNLLLRKLLEKNSIEFMFNDTVFELTANKISRYYINLQKTPQAISIGDYNWFKTSLEIYILDNQLTILKLSEKKNKIIEDLVDANREQIIARNILKILINDADPSSELIKTLNLALKQFVLEKHFNLSKALRRSFDRQGEINSGALKNILTSQLNAESMCKRYIENQWLNLDVMLADAPHSMHEFKHVYNMYHETLITNLKRSIKKSGSIKFTFGDTIFELFIDSIKRYDLLGNPQALTFSDLKWFMSALEIYTINYNLREKGLFYNKDRLAEILGVKVEYIYNREIKDIFPEADDCFRSRIKKIVLSLPLRSDALTHRLKQLDSDPIYIPSANRSLNINETSILGALAFFLTNSSLMLNALVAKSPELTHVNDDPCDKNNSNDNNVNWLIIGGGITATIAFLIAGGYVWNYFRKKSQDNHLDLRQKRDSASELEILESLKTQMDALKIEIKHNVTKDAYRILEETFSLINQRFENLIDMHKSSGNSNTFFNMDQENYKHYKEVFEELIKILKMIQKNLDKLKLKCLNKRVTHVLVSLSGIRPLPQVAVEQQCLLPNTNNSQQQENNPPRYTKHPYTKNTFSNFGDLTFKFNSDQNNENNEQKTEEPIYANPRAGRS